MAEQVLSVVFQNILCEIRLCLPDDRICPQNSQRLNPKVNQQLLPMYRPLESGFFPAFPSGLSLNVGSLPLFVRSLLMSRGRTPIQIK